MSPVGCAFRFYIGCLLPVGYGCLHILEKGAQSCELAGIDYAAAAHAGLTVPPKMQACCMKQLTTVALRNVNCLSF